MTYYLGLDIGTTYTAAAVWRDGRVEVASLGTRGATIPSVVLLREDGEVLTGEAAERRARSEPHRVAREFKRRIGDSVPIIIGGTPYSADALTAKMLRAVVDAVSEVEGGPPAGIAVSHPANWGEYKKDLLRQAISLADLDGVTTLTEPEAAAIHYASQERVPSGSVIAVFDLGGGTFDAAVLRKDDQGWSILGEPQGIERLGGIDFDEAVFRHTIRVTDGAIEQLDPDQPSDLAAITKLRQECVEAKEALSSDTETSIPVLLPSLQTEVRITRTEFEQMVRPVIGDAIGAMQRALRSAGVEAGDVTAVLLVGGSSRIPLVAQLVGSDLGRPVAVDAHPKHGIALGAAIVAAERAQAGTAEGTQVQEAVERTAPSIGAAGAAGVAGAAAAGAVAGAAMAGESPAAAAPPPAPAAPPAPTPPPTTPHQAAPPPAAAAPPPAAAAPPAPAAPPPAPAAPPVDAQPTAPQHPQQQPAVPAAAAAGGYGGSSGGGSTPPVPPPAAAPFTPSPDSGSKGGGAAKGVLFGALAVLGVVLAVGAYILLSGGDDDGGIEDATATEGGSDEPVIEDDDGPATTADPDSTDGTTGTTNGTTATTAGSDDPQVIIDGVFLDQGQYVTDHRTVGYTPEISDDPESLHIHFFFNTTEPENAGVNGTPPGDWKISDDATSFLTGWGPEDAGGADQMCAVVATFDHQVFDPDSGNCVDIPG